MVDAGVESVFASGQTLRVQQATGESQYRAKSVQFHGEIVCQSKSAGSEGLFPAWIVFVALA